MAPPTKTQLVWRRRIESVLRIAAPALDVVLAVGERVSRAVDRESLEGSPQDRLVTDREAPRTVGAGAEARE